MKILKKKFKKRVSGGGKLKHPVFIMPKLKIKPKQGRWCEYYEGRIPYPIECSSNKDMPISQIFKGREIITIRSTPNCTECQRTVEWQSWKRGDWDKIMNAIKAGEDLTDMDPPNQEER